MPHRHWACRGDSNLLGLCRWLPSVSTSRHLAVLWDYSCATACGNKTAFELLSYLPCPHCVLTRCRAFLAALAAVLFPMEFRHVVQRGVLVSRDQPRRVLGTREVHRVREPAVAGSDPPHAGV